VSLSEQVEQSWGDGLFLAQPEVENLLDRPRRFAEILEPDHPAAALEGVSRTTDPGQQFHVVWPAVR
jgi:hypothetical protein